MRFFIDTANIDEIKEINQWGVVDGVTTNPSLIAKEGKDIKEVIEEICKIVDGPISAEVISQDVDGMIAEAKELAAIHENVVIKIPMTEDGLMATKELEEAGIRTNVTLVFSPQQALLAARAGASYVSPFVGRIDDIGYDGIDLVESIADLYHTFDIDTQIIAASLRNPKHVLQSANVGADIGTVPYDVFSKMLEHPLTSIGLENFIKDWEESQSK